MLKLRTGDLVRIISGDCKKQTGKILKISQNRVIVEGMNLRVHHIRPSQGKAGGRISKEAPIHISNLELIHPETGNSGRVYFLSVGNQKKRALRKTGDVIND